ncbi:hypothetical protein HGRIS_009995 [Hohenbuehelia grisea]|uniref:Uncharacterized protein n=1 Tax=Hohenbuehelia grisea TaxID=104357 RepID=A0ABR3J2W8_9AGAR
MYTVKLFLVLSSLFVVSILSIPTWDGYSRDAIGSIVPGATFIEAIGPATREQMYMGHLSTAKPGHPGNLTYIQNQQPPLFLINQNWLWQINNETSIYRVNVLNTTGVENLPLQLVLGTKAEGIKTGTWRWRGSMLYYDQANGDHQGLFYSCPSADGGFGIFMYIKSAAPPLGCEILTLHSTMPKNPRSSWHQ